jgi:hypothetical protein
MCAAVRCLLLRVTGKVGVDVGANADRKQSHNLQCRLDMRNSMETWLSADGHTHYLRIMRFFLA